MCHVMVPFSCIGEVFNQVLSMACGYCWPGQLSTGLAMCWHGSAGARALVAGAGLICFFVFDWRGRRGSLESMLQVV